MATDAIDVHVNNLSVMFFSLAIALIVTSLFTGYKQPKYVAVFYIGISILNVCFNLPMFCDTIYWALHLLALPFTFLYTGFYLKSRLVRGS